MQKKRSVSDALPLFTAMHFLVDLACIFLETAYIIPVVANRRVWLVCLLLYNFTAFACQLPIGILGDRIKRNSLLSGVGCLLVAAAYGLFAVGLSLSGGAAVGLSAASLSAAGGLSAAGLSAAAGPALPPAWLTAVLPAAVSVVAGIGNSCFHVGGGIEMLEESQGRASRPGIFVSSGAFGVWMGPVLAAREWARNFGLAAGALTMLLCGAILCAFKTGSDAGSLRDLPEPAYARHTEGMNGMPPRKPAMNRESLFRTAVLCLMTGILLRSYAGTVMNFGWKRGMLAFLFTAGVVFGKALGGIAGDCFGWFRTAVASLLLSGLLFLAADRLPAAGMAAVLCFNMTMPLTLSALTGMYPGSPGAAFGMTTLALFLGTLPSVLQSAAQLGMAPEVFAGQSGAAASGAGRALFLVAVVSAALMAAGLILSRRTVSGEETPL